MRRISKQDAYLLEKIVKSPPDFDDFCTICCLCPLSAYCDDDTTVSELRKYAKEMLDRYCVESILLEE